MKESVRQMVDAVRQREYLTQALLRLNVSDADARAAQMLAFMALVLKRNEVVNLTTITDEDAFIDKHLIDSVLCFGWPELTAAETIADVGTGAGFPGMPLAILYPEKRFVLMDSLGKRTTFLSEAVHALGIQNVTVVKCRAEDAGRDRTYRGRFDLCVCRAIARLSVLFEYTLPLLKVGGSLYAYKTNRAISEIEDSETARRLLGGSKEVSIRLLDSGEQDFGHNIMVTQKERPTPATYPRRAGIPAKVPL
jgi:16S rRNA (guanine527-N7)-methyltransferase